MRLERSKIEFPLWRKKVDKSLFDYSGTTIPTWVCNMWGIQGQYSKVEGKTDPQSMISIRFNRNIYPGHVTVAKKGRKTPAYRLWFGQNLTTELKKVFLMSHMRALEHGLSNKSVKDIEEEIPFWEFLDIEYKSKQRQFDLVAYYTQKPSFPNLFHRLIESPAIARVEAEISKGESRPKILNTDWKPRSELEFQIGKTNVIYTLLDSKAKLIYIGEALDLVKRLGQKYPSIPNWDYFRFDVLPDEFFEYRVTIERLLIRSYASTLNNKKGVETIGIGEYRLANDKIDK